MGDFGWAILAVTRFAEWQNASDTGVIPKSPAASVGSGGLLLAIPLGLVKAAPIVFFVLLGGAALTVVEITGAVAAILDSLAKYFVRRPLLVLPLVSLLFLFGAASYAMSEEIVAFIPLLCALMHENYCSCSPQKVYRADSEFENFASIE
jgi:uncharacterized ion transporter superfamily protein YfcC